MKVMLVQPAQLDRQGQPIIARTAWFDDLTLAYLTALTPSGIDCLPVLERFDGVDFDADVDLVAITAMGVSPMLRAYQIAERFRARGVPVVLGGTNFSIHPQEAKRHADAVVLGEAERVWRQLLEDAQRGELQPFYQADLLDDLAGLPVPRYEIFRQRKEFRNALFTVQASRGCPHRCDFCAIGAFHQGQLRFRPIDEVIRDIRATRSRNIFFADDNMMARPEYYKELFRRLIPLKVRWVGATTLTIGRDREMLELARRSGCVLLIIGVESVGEESLRSVGKTFNRVNDYSRHLEAIHDAGIIASCTTIFGFDGDDDTVFDRTVDFYLENRVRVAPLFLLTPVPGTVSWKKLKGEGRILTEDYSRYDTVTAVFQPARMSPSELEEGLMYAYKRLYGLRASTRRLFPLLGNPWADLLAGVMNLQYFRLARSGAFGAFNFN